MKKKTGEKEVERVAIDCIFRGLERSREFTTPSNFEAFNMLKNKLDKRGVPVDQPGKLIFEFVPGELPTDSSPFLKRKDIDNLICTCGHNKFVHTAPKKSYPYREACRVKRCRCHKYDGRRG